MKPSRVIIAITVSIIVITSLAISLPGAFKTEPLWPDGQRYVFNGILIHDMVRDKAIFHPYEYAVNFYAQYPSTNLPYGPPFFALVFAAAFGLFGISFSVARCIISLYTVCAAVMCWYAIYSITKNYWNSILATAIFIFYPLTVFNARDITPELPIVFFSFLSIYFFYNYLEKNKKGYGIATAVSLGLGYLTKPYIVPLGLAFVVYFFLRRKWSLLRDKETWLGILLLVILTVPYTFLGFKYSTADLGLRPLPPITWESIVSYPKIVAKMSPVFTLVSIIGFIVGLKGKDKLVLLSLAWAISWYVFFSIILGWPDIDKYLVTFVPALVAPFVTGCDVIVQRIKGRVRFKYLGIVVTVAIISFLVFRAAKMAVYYVDGYEEAGKFVAENQTGRSLLVYSSYDGAFMMGIRKNPPHSAAYVLRGDRQLATRLWWGELRGKTAIKSPDEIISKLNKYRTGYVVVEMDMPIAKEFQEYKILLQSLENNHLFKEVARFPIKTNYRKLGPALVVYKFDYDETVDEEKTLTIPVPTLGDDLRVHF